VALVRTEVSEDLSASFIRMTRIGELRTMLALTSNLRMLRRNHFAFLCGMCRLLVRANVSSTIHVTLMKEALSSTGTSVLTRATWHNIPEGAILQVSSLIEKHLEELQNKIKYFFPFI
jgi:hypothetical protein